LGGTHAFRSNLFAAKPAKRISTTIVAAIQSLKKLISQLAFLDYPIHEVILKNYILTPLLQLIFVLSQNNIHEHRRIQTQNRHNNW